MRDAIDSLYDAFAKYQRPETFDACLCCIPGPEGWGEMGQHAQLPSPGGTTPLREVSADDLYAFAENVPGTCGDEPTYKHYLPRILELAAQQERYSDQFPELEMMLGKLDGGFGQFTAWSTWPEPEVAAIRGFLHACWTRALATDDVDDARDVLSALMSLEDDLGPYLEEWATTAATALERKEAFDWLERPSAKYERARANYEFVRAWIDAQL